MGGGAFLQAAAAGEPTLRTPRMNADTYLNLRKTYTQRLQDYFPDCKVSPLLEAPEKSDHGDLDFIVSTVRHVDLVDLARRVGARGVICLGNETVQHCNLAVPMDGSRSERPAVVYGHANARNADRQPPVVFEDADYAQIDVAMVPPQLFTWHSFYASYGDISSLLGKLVHHFGFTVTDKGLWLRLQELDDVKAANAETTRGTINVDDGQGKLFLSRDPDQVMQFLGFSPDEYHKGFATLDEFFEWLAECRFLSPDTIRYRRDNSRERNKEKRMVYTRFLEEWLPKHFGIQPRDDEDETEQPAKPADVTERRRELRDEAIAFFNKRKEFEPMQSALVLSIRNQTAANLLKPFIAQHSNAKNKKLTEILRAFRRWVVFDQGQPRIALTPHTDEESQLYLWLAKDHQSLSNTDRTSDFVQANWEKVKALERHRLKDAREDRST